MKVICLIEVGRTTLLYVINRFSPSPVRSIICSSLNLRINLANCIFLPNCQQLFRQANKDLQNVIKWNREYKYTSIIDENENELKLEYWSII